MPAAERTTSSVNLQRAVVIGLGGTGAQVLRRLRRLIVDRFGGFDRLPIVRFLYLDTDPETIRELSSEIDEEIRISTAELVDLQLPDASGLYAGIAAGNFPHYDWFSLERLRDFRNVTHGAGTIRQLGRLCFWQHAAQVQDKLAAHLRGVNSDANARFMQDRYGQSVDPGINVHIIAGLAGGTGSGCFLDMAYMARQVLTECGIGAANEITGYLVLPAAYADLAGTNSLPNGYAALKELNYHSYLAGGSQNSLAAVFGAPEWVVQYQPDPAGRVESTRAPFDAVYLLDRSNERVQLQRQDIFAMLARSLFHEFALEFASFKRSLRANVRHQLTSNDRLDCPARFMSFGESSIFFPLRAVQQLLTHQLALRAVQEWVDRTGAPVELARMSDEKTDAAESVVASIAARAESEEVRGGVRAELVGHFLPGQGFRAADVLSAVIADDKTRLVDVPYQLRETEKQRWISERWKRDEFQGRLTAAWQRWRGDFSDDGPDPTAWGEQIRWMVVNRERALVLYRKRIHDYAMEAFHDSRRGPAWALSFVSQMSGPLHALQERFLAEANSAVAIAEALGDVFLINAAQQSHGPSLSQIVERRLGEEYQNLDEIIHQGMSFLFHGEDRLRSQAYVYLTWCAHWCRARVEERSRRLAAELCGSLLTGLDELKQSISQTARVLAFVQARIAQRGREWAQKGATTEVVGTLLYDPALLPVLERKVAELRGDVYDPVAVGNSALAARKLRLDQLQEKDLEPLFEALIEASTAAVGNLSETDLSQTTFSAHDLLAARCQDRNELERTLETTIERGSPFVRLETNPPGGYWTPRGAFPAGLVEIRGAGIRGGYQPNDQDPERVQVLSALQRAGWDPANEVGAVGDSEQIVFIQECGGFPLRALAGIQEMKTAYEHHRRNPQGPPLHLVRDEQADRYPDLLPPNPPDLARAQSVWTIGTALSRIQERSMGVQDGRGPRRAWVYAQPVVETGGEMLVDLGTTSAEAVMRLAGSPKLATGIAAELDRLVEQADDQTKQSVVTCLLGQLDEAGAAAERDAPGVPRSANPVFAAEQERVVEFMRRHSLRAPTTGTN